MSGIVTFAGAAGKTYRVRVNRRDKLARSAGRFRLELPPGSYKVSDLVSRDRGGRDYQSTVRRGISGYLQTRSSR